MMETTRQTKSVDGVIHEEADVSQLFPHGAISIILCTNPISGTPLPFIYRVYLDNFKAPRPLNRAMDFMFQSTWVGNIAVVKYARACSSRRRLLIHLQKAEAEILLPIIAEYVSHVTLKESTLISRCFRSWIDRAWKDLCDAGMRGEDIPRLPL